MRRQPAYLIYDFTFVMTLSFLAAIVLDGFGDRSWWVVSLVAMTLLWITAWIVGRRQGLSPVDYARQLGRPVSESRDEPPPQD